jgi:hypothetical protein
MANFGLFLVVAFSIDGGANAADDLSDFSNNLATDLGPLIVLFGEPMTKQFLSESTTFLDYFRYGAHRNYYRCCLCYQSM